MLALEIAFDLWIIEYIILKIEWQFVAIYKYRILCLKSAYEVGLRYRP